MRTHLIKFNFVLHRLCMLMACLREMKVVIVNVSLQEACVCPINKGRRSLFVFSL